jgi:hypothetical protein
MRIAVGVRTVLRLVIRYPMLAGFLARNGWPSVDTTPPFHAVVGATLVEGIERGRFADVPVALARSALVGTLLGAIHVSMTEPVSPELAERTAEVILRALGLAGDEAKTTASAPLATDSLDFDPVLGKLIAGESF